MVRVVNASRKGETSERGRKRLQALLEKNKPSFVILQLGANDGLRKRSLETLKKNLNDMLSMIRASGAIPILVGMELPPDYEFRYAERFAAVYPDVAQENGSAFVPFLLNNVVDHPELFLPDHRHPNADAQSMLLDNVWPVLNSVLPPR